MYDPYEIRTDPLRPRREVPDPPYVKPTKQERDQALGKVISFLFGVGAIFMAMIGKAEGAEFVVWVVGIFAIWYALADD